MGTEVKSHEDLRIWKGARTLVLEIYKLTSEFPKHEVYGLISQMRRASVSVPSNIAEGAGRRSPGDFCRFLYYASGSLTELETQLYLSGELGYADKVVVSELKKEIILLRRQIYATIRSLKKTSV
jgi:four helix bundle protein